MLGQHQQEEEGVGEEEMLGGVRAVDVHHDDAGGKHPQQELCNVGYGAAEVDNLKGRFSQLDPFKRQSEDQNTKEMEKEEDEKLEVSN